MDLLIPAAGLASRMRGLPKFLLPIDSKYTTLLENHLYYAAKENNELENIFIATRPDLVTFIKNLDLGYKNLAVIEMDTKTMNETILNLIEYSKSEYFQVVMPDTYFLHEQPYGILSNNPALCDLGIWKIRPEQRGKLGEVEIDPENYLINIIDKNPNSLLNYSWGTLTFSHELIKYIKPEEPHIGYAISNALKHEEKITTKIINGQYFDCGTSEEYFDLLKEVLKLKIV